MEMESIDAETLKRLGVVGEAKRLLKPYPEMNADLEEALSRKEATSLNAFDIVFLFKHQDDFCEKCGRCCRTQSPIVVTQLDLARIARYLRVPYKKLKKRLKLAPRRGGVFVLMGKPCPFLRGNLCSVYEARPLVCRLYPAIHMYSCFVDGKPVPLDLECGVIRKLLAWKLAAVAAALRVEREEPGLVEELRLEARKLWDSFMPSDEEIENIPPEEQLVWLDRWLQAFRRYVEKGGKY